MFEDTATFQNSVLDSPDIVLRRFQRCIALEQQQNNEIDCNRELALKISSLREILRENSLGLERHKSRYQKLLNEVKTQEDELQNLCAQIVNYLFYSLILLFNLGIPEWTSREYSSS